MNYYKYIDTSVTRSNEDLSKDINHIIEANLKGIQLDCQSITISEKGKYELAIALSYILCYIDDFPSDYNKSKKQIKNHDYSQLKTIKAKKLQTSLENNEYYSFDDDVYRINSKTDETGIIFLNNNAIFGENKDVKKLVDFLNQQVLEINQWKTDEYISKQYEAIFYYLYTSLKLINERYLSGDNFNTIISILNSFIEKNNNIDQAKLFKTNAANAYNSLNPFGSFISTKPVLNDLDIIKKNILKYINQIQNEKSEEISVKRAKCYELYSTINEISTLIQRNIPTIKREYLYNSKAWSTIYDSLYKYNVNSAELKINNLLKRATYIKKTLEYLISENS